MANLLANLARMHRHAADEARTTLSLCLEAEISAHRRVASEKKLLEHEAGIAAGFEVEMAKQSNFPAWLKQRQAALTDAEHEWQKAVENTQQARIGVFSAKTAEKTISHLKAQEDVARDLAASKQELGTLGEIVLQALRREASE
jgi:hypothetical protein